MIYPLLNDESPKMLGESNSKNEKGVGEALLIANDLKDKSNKMKEDIISLAKFLNLTIDESQNNEPGKEVVHFKSRNHLDEDEILDKSA